MDMQNLKELKTPQEKGKITERTENLRRIYYLLYFPRSLYTRQTTATTKGEICAS